jgi:uncharacterized membrane protein HdeD (DUF308 family)
MTGRLGARSVAPAAPWILELELTQDDLRRVRRWLLIFGTLAIVAGVLCIAVPAIASVAITLFIGWFLMGTAILLAADAWAMRSAPHRPLRLLNALLTFVAGLLLVVAPHSGTLTLTFLLAAWFFATGVVLLATWWQQRGLPGAVLAAFNGVVSLLLGLLIVLDLPSSADWAIGLLVGVNLALWGARALFAATVLRRALKA